MNSASLSSLAGRYDNPIPTRFLAPIDCLKIPALYSSLLVSSGHQLVLKVAERYTFINPKLSTVKIIGSMNLSASAYADLSDAKASALSKHIYCRINRLLKLEL
jgi:hypothetical protein